MPRLPWFPSSTTASNPTVPELNSQSKWVALLERYTSYGQEIGWAQLDGQERLQRVEVDLAGARAELVLLEQDTNGPLGLDEQTLRAILKEAALRDRGSTTPPVDSPSPASNPVWRWNWRRAVALISILTIVGLLSTNLYPESPWKLPALLACVFAFLAIGPWVGASSVLAKIDVFKQTSARFRNRSAQLALDAEIKRREQEIIDAMERHSKATDWVNERLDIVRERYETERSRAEMASRIARGGPVPRPALTSAGRLSA